MGEDQAPPRNREIARLTQEGPCSQRDLTSASEMASREVLELISVSDEERDPRGGKG